MTFCQSRPVTCDRRMLNAIKCLRTNLCPLPSQTHQSELLPSVLAVRIFLLLFFAQSSLYSTCLVHLQQCTAENIALDSMCLIHHAVALYSYFCGYQFCQLVLLVHNFSQVSSNFRNHRGIYGRKFPPSLIPVEDLT